MGCGCVSVCSDFLLSVIIFFFCLFVCMLTFSGIPHWVALIFPKLATNSAKGSFELLIIVVLCPVSWHVLMCELWYVHICAHLCGSQKTTSWSFFKNLLSLFLFWVGWYWIFVCFVLDRVPECPEPCHVGKDGRPSGILGKYSTNWATTLAQIHCNLYIWRVFCWKNPLEIDNGCL